MFGVLFSLIAPERRANCLQRVNMHILSRRSVDVLQKGLLQRSEDASLATSLLVAKARLHSVSSLRLAFKQGSYLPSRESYVGRS